MPPISLFPPPPPRFATRPRSQPASSRGNTNPQLEGDLPSPLPGGTGAPPAPPGDGRGHVLAAFPQSPQGVPLAEALLPPSSSCVPDPPTDADLGYGEVEAGGDPDPDSPQLPGPPRGWDSDGGGGGGWDRGPLSVQPPSQVTAAGSLPAAAAATAAAGEMGGLHAHETTTSRPPTHSRGNSSSSSGASALPPYPAPYPLDSVKELAGEGRGDPDARTRPQQSPQGPQKPLKTTWSVKWGEGSPAPRAKSGNLDSLRVPGGALPSFGTYPAAAMQAQPVSAGGYLPYPMGAADHMPLPPPATAKARKKAHMGRGMRYKGHVTPFWMAYEATLCALMLAGVCVLLWYSLWLCPRVAPTVRRWV